jgi:DNA-binding SARP family transcriptional activator
MAMPQVVRATDTSVAAALVRRPVLSIALFRGCSVYLDGREIAIPSRKGKALLGYLAFTKNHSETRERLVGMLWSETAEERARGSLRQTLRALRDTLEAAGFNGFNTLYSDPGFERGTVMFDALEAIESVNRDWPIDDLLDHPRIADTLMAGFEDIDPSFRNWLAVQRENLAQKLQRQLQDRLSANAEGTPSTQRLATALLQLDPTHEPACRQILRARANSGDMAGAIAVYNRLCDVLASVHDQPPDAATGDLIVAIKDGSYQSHARAEVGKPVALGLVSTADAPVANSPLAVTQQKLVLIIGSFDHVGDRKDLAFAFRHELISRLTKFREWQLVDGTPQILPIAENAPCYTLEAPLLQDAQDLNLFLSLKDSRSGVVLWSERTNLELTCFFKSLQQVMRQIAAKLNVYISVERLNRLAAAPDVALDVYDRWLRGQALMQEYKTENRQRAKKIFKSIVDDAPQFSPAYSGLAQISNSNHIACPGVYQTINDLQQSEFWAKRAVSLDPLDSRAHLCLAWWQAMSGRHELAEGTFQLALGLNDGDTWTAISAALGFAYCDKPRIAMQLADSVWALTPPLSTMHFAYQTQIRYLCGDYEGCLQAYSRVDGTICYLPPWAAAALHHGGNSAAARDELITFLAAVRRSWQGGVAPTRDAVLRWFVNCFPIRNQITSQRLYAAIEAASIDPALNPPN